MKLQQLRFYWHSKLQKVFYLREHRDIIMGSDEHADLAFSGKDISLLHCVLNFRHQWVSVPIESYDFGLSLPNSDELKRLVIGLVTDFCK